jgi:hypothetical protein
MTEPTTEEIDAALAFYELDRQLCQAAAYKKGTGEGLEAERRRRLKPWVVTLWVLGVLIAVVAVALLSIWLGGKL